MKYENYEDWKTKLNTYEEWKHCITVQCGIPLTSDYIAQRMTELNDLSNEHTKKFVKTWGEPQLKKVIAWFEEAKQDTKT